VVLHFLITVVILCFTHLLLVAVRKRRDAFTKDRIPDCDGVRGETLFSCCIELQRWATGQHKYLHNQSQAAYLCVWMCVCVYWEGRVKEEKQGEEEMRSL
jgi:hypothetical protein